MNHVLSQRLCALIADLPRPVCAYVYDLAALRQRVQGLLAALPEGVELFYAMKANAEPRLLRALLPLVHGFETASLGEIELIRSLSTECAVTLGGPAKTDGELQGALAAGVKRVHLESLNEIERMAAVAARVGRRVAVLLRISPDLGSDFPDDVVRWRTQFGLDESSLPAALTAVQQNTSLKFEGFHFHVVSNNTHHALHADVTRALLSKVAGWSQKFALEPSCVNLGGGMGISYAGDGHDLDWAAFIDAIRAQATEQVRAGRGLVLESGRFITAHCGYYAAEVLDIKTNHGTNYVLVRGGTHHLRLPASLGHNQPFVVLRSPHVAAGAASLRNARATIVGQLCTPTDVLARNVMLEEIRAGDVLVFQKAGAYGWTISPHDFLCHPHPERYFLD